LTFAGFEEPGSECGFGGVLQRDEGGVGFLGGMKVGIVFVLIHA
jgi:hypothetical protein